MCGNSTQVAQIPLATVVKVPVEELVMDPKNPRLLTAAKTLTQDQIIAHLYRAENLCELLQSIAANGYLDIEPFIVIEEEGRLLVLEGNRRLAAILFFRVPDLVRLLRSRELAWLNLPDISDEHRKALDKISVYRVARRSDARPFIGFKHINGAARWNSYAEAKFVADWYRSKQASFSEIARSVGDTHSAVKRMVNTIYLLEQAQSEQIFEIDDRTNARFNFSYLYSALARVPYMLFLGLDADWPSDNPPPDPVSRDKIARLSELLLWIYGSQTQRLKPVVQSLDPDILQLGEVLASDKGLETLRASRCLSKAHASTKSAEQRFTEALIRTDTNLREAVTNLRGYDGRLVSPFGLAANICDTAEALRNRMERKLTKAARRNN